MRRTLLALMAVAALPLSSPPARAGGDVQFTAQPDRTEISQDDSVSIKFTIRSEGSSGSVDNLRYTAPDFDEVNEYSGVFVESYYENGRFGMRNNRQITKVLRPRKPGDLQVSGIQVTVGGQVYTAPTIKIHVTPGGAGTPPPRGYGGSGVGLRGAGKHHKSVSFFVRAEVDKQKVYKGEQVIVSYYLYRRARVFNIEVDKYPTLTGFLREDLDMPVLGQRLDTEQVVLDGVPYERSLLVRYAAYPLKEGKLTIDPMTIKAQYTAPLSFGDDDDDQDPFLGFFRQIAPRTSDSTSDPLTLQVLPLPTDGKPADFSGAVGEFNVSSSADRTEVRANEPVTLKLRIQGKGNLSSIEQPKGDWPGGVELYEAKGENRNTKGGVGEKDFEYLLIPRSPGKLTLPALQFSYFDPGKKTYVTKKTEPLEINVLPPAPGTTPPAASVTQPQTTAQNALGSDGGSDLLQRLWALRWLGFGILGLLALFALFSGVRAGARAVKTRAVAKRNSREEQDSRRWSEIRSIAKRATSGAPWSDVARAYELLSGVIYDGIDRLHAIGSRSLAREELGTVLLHERRISPDQWARCARLLEYAETLRYALSAGAVTEEMARRDLAKWISEARLLSEELGRL